MFLRKDGFFIFFKILLSSAGLVLCCFGCRERESFLLLRGVRVEKFKVNAIVLFYDFCLSQFNSICCTFMVDTRWVV